MKKSIFLIFFTTILTLPTLAESAGSGYPAPIYKNCSTTQEKAIDDAYKKLKKAIDNPATSIGSDLSVNLKKKLTGQITINCNDSYLACTHFDLKWEWPFIKTNDICAFTYLYASTVDLCASGLSGGGCGCIEAVMLHEFVHTVGYPDERVPQECEKAVFACAVTEDKYKGCCCK